jgi:hypothetical protein
LTDNNISESNRKVMAILTNIIKEIRRVLQIALVNLSQVPVLVVVNVHLIKRLASSRKSICSGYNSRNEQGITLIY